LMNGPEAQTMTLQFRKGLMASLSAPFFDNTQKIETLFLATLSRFPTDEERKAFAESLSISEDATNEELQDAIGDALWVLLNTAEFTVCP
ncbi:MAG: hypothetical protein AAFP90_16410, partial [Planctomycetota bacterium]